MESAPLGIQKYRDHFNRLTVTAFAIASDMEALAQ